MTVTSLPSRAGRILGWSLLGLVLVLFFALAGGMAFLRTQPGERWIADTAVSVLKMWVLSCWRNSTASRFSCPPNTLGTHWPSCRP